MVTLQRGIHTITHAHRRQFTFSNDIYLLISHVYYVSERISIEFNLFAIYIAFSHSSGTERLSKRDGEK